MQAFICSNRLKDISNKHIGAALYQATLNSHEKIALDVLGIYASRKIPVSKVDWFSNDGGEACKYASQQGLVTFVKKFVSSTLFDTVMPIQAKAFLILAQTRSHESIVRFLEKSDRFNSKIKFS